MSAETRIQGQLKTLLKANARLADIMMLTEEIGDLEQAIKLRLGPLAKPEGSEKRGLVLVIMTPVAELLDEDVTVLTRQIPTPIILMENPLVNRKTGGTEKLPLDVIEDVMAAVHHKPNGEPGREVLCRFKLEKIPYQRLQVEKDVLQQMGFTALVLYQINVTTIAGGIKQTV